MMEIQEIMTKEVSRVTATTPVREVIQLILTHKFSGVPVVDASDHLIGMVSEKDITKRLLPSYKDFFATTLDAMQYTLTEMKRNELIALKAQDIMISPVVSIRPDTPVMRACAIMIANRFRRLPVVDAQGKMLGIISQGDVFRALLEFATAG